MTKRQVLIVGCGNIAGGFDVDRTSGEQPLTHAGAYRANGGFEIAACVEPDGSRRRDFQERWEVPEGAASIAELQSPSGRFDVVSICSPTHVHADHVRAAIALRPRLIFCEKPLSPTVEETERLVRECAEAGATLAINFTRRWAPDISHLARELRDGRWGEIRSAVALYNKGVLHNGAHLIDLLRLLVGDCQLVATGSPRFDYWEDDPSVPALLQSETGVPINLATGDAADYAVFEMTLVTARGTISMLDGGRRWAIRQAAESDVFAGYRTLGAADFRPGGYEGAMIAAIENIAASISAGAPLASDGSNAIAAQRLCESIRLASRQRRDPLIHRNS